ncbi:MAG: hypothetical protein DWQ04_26750 [Chloroflexi bacterium]|nr:MAG: hypothetical protein DWQ04_26750 [Chloroflexota bacterium]
MKPQHILIYIGIIGIYLLIAVSCRGGFNRVELPASGPTLDEQANAMANQASAAATAAADVASGTRVPFVPISDEGPAAAMATSQAIDGNPANPNPTDVLIDQAVDIIVEAEKAMRAIELPDFTPFIAERLTAVQVTGNNSYAITTSDAEMTQAMLTAQANDGSTPTLQNPSVQFTSGTMILTGTMSEPNLGEVTVTMQPVVENGRLQFNITSASVGSTNIPTFILNGTAATLNGTLGSLSNNLPAGYTLQGVAISEGIMQVFVVKV